MNVIAWILAIIGAINWGLVGFAKFDLVAWICGGQTAWVSRVIYALVGLAGLWCIVTLLTRDRKTENSWKKQRTDAVLSAVFIFFGPMRLYPRLQRTMH